MTTYLNNYQDNIYKTNIYDYYNGVLKISTGVSYGTGNLLYDGRSVLTAAHIFDGIDYDDIKIYIYDGSKNFTLNAKVTIYNNYDETNINGDLAIVTFKTNLNKLYNRYDIYRQDDEINQNFTAIGYGSIGSGNFGFIDSSDIYKLKITNSFDADFKTLINYSNIKLSWNPLINSILISDFDNGYSSTDIIGYLNDSSHLGTGYTEGMIASGDSGGSAFINDYIAGIASYTTKMETNKDIGDINNFLDSSFGEIAAYQRVSYYQEFIDKTIRANYPNAPKSRDEVKKQVSEKDAYAYFMLEFLPSRDTVNDVISVDYTTIDGTAKSGEDFISAFGTLNLYKDESYAIIAVELINDNKEESNEYFYLQISNPSHGSFGENVVTLSAIKTIVDDDFIA
ncbi:MAG: trypsin-like serine protease [Arcobacter sp.]|uniref:Calx-beta domain-containing protein n=1 Tax=Arcobacter sp. TaxID=1872629 RepID=UPI002A7563F8|nr:trypsin-like serine protease [Arcobacter sp.]MDY3203464.1 trypsin-like serine protease [Arcobacter sp.]